MSSAESALLREWCMRVIHEGMSSAESALLHEWCTRAREWYTRVVPKSGAQECSRLREWWMRLSEWCKRKSLVDWAWILQGKLSRLGMEPPWQTLVKSAWNLQGKQAVDWAWDLQGKHLVDWAWVLLI